MAQQRDTIHEISPPWLRTGTAERLLYVLGISGDLLLEKLNQAVKAHMPGVGTSTALVYVGNDRMINKGPFESDDDYAGRLQRAFPSWQIAGSRRAILSQVVQYLKSPAVLLPASSFDASFDGTFTSTTPAHFPTAAIVGGADLHWETYYTSDDVVNSPPARYVPIAGEADDRRFNWQGLPPPPTLSTEWWRAWLVIYCTPVALGRTGAVASMISFNGFASVTGLSGMLSADVGRMLVISGAASGGHNGMFRIEFVNSSTQVIVSCGVSIGADANNGSISWSVLEFPTLKPGPAWDSPDFVWDDPNHSWGLNNPPGVMAGVQEIVSQWQSAHSVYLDVVIVFSGYGGEPFVDFSPYSQQGSGLPDGTWEHFSKIVGGVSVPARVFTGIDDEKRSKFNEFCGGPPE